MTEVIYGGAVWPYKTPYKTQIVWPYKTQVETPYRELVSKAAVLTKYLDEVVLDRELVSKLGRVKAAIMTMYLDDQMKLKVCNEEEEAWMEALKADREKRAEELLEHRRLKEVYKELRWKELQWKQAQEEALEALQRNKKEFTKAQMSLPIEENLQTPKPPGCMAFVRRLFNRN